MQLRLATPQAWVDVVMADFDSFLLDHAACERKAAATGMSFVVRYPNRHELLDPLIEFAREELEHFHRVYRVISKRGLTLAHDEKDHYVGRLRKLARGASEEHLLDRLLIAGVIEARGCERLAMISEVLEDGELKALYLDLARAEARHHGLFVRLAKLYFADDVVRARLDELLEAESSIVAELPLRAAVH